MHKLEGFHSTFGSDRTPYQGSPNNEVDEAWEALYNGIALLVGPGE
jgi:hypothetical protein